MPLYDFLSSVRLILSPKLPILFVKIDLRKAVQFLTCFNKPYFDPKLVPKTKIQAHNILSLIYPRNSELFDIENTFEKIT